MVQRRGFDEGVALEHTKRYKKSTVEKYAEAIERLKTTDLPTSKVAAEFGLNPETFRMYLREHYPELVAVRGMVKASNGKTVSNRSAEKYAEALHIYETTPESLLSIAKRLGLTYNSVGGFIRRNYPEAIEKHNSLLTSTEQTFAKGVEMLKSGNATIHAVMDVCGYNDYFRTYIKNNHPELLLRKTERKQVQRKQKTADKYAAAIEYMKSSTDTMKSIAEQFGLNLHSFRKYLYKYTPEILKTRNEKP